MYQAAGGQLVAPTSADTQRAWAEAQAMQGLGMSQYGQDINAYTGMLGQVAPQTAGQIQDLTNQLYGGYLGGAVAPAAGLLAPYMNINATTGAIGQGAQNLMSPYIGTVIAPTMALGQQALAQNLQQIGAGANQAGAFGGTRQGVQEGVAQAQTALGESNLLGQMLQSGWGQALQPATTAEAQGYGAAGTLGQALLGGYTGQQAVGQGIANQNLAAGLTSASQLQNALAAQQNAAMQQQQLLSQTGTAEQQAQQAQINAALTNFAWQQYYPEQQQNMLLSTLGSIPYGTTTTSSGYNYNQGKTSYDPSLASTIGGAASLGSSLLGSSAGGGSGLLGMIGMLAA